jgi:transposase
MSKLDRTDAPVAAEYATMQVAFELSKKKWKLGVLLPGSQKLSRYAIAGGDLAELTKLLALARQRAERSSGKPVRVLSCYEAGYDGHWLHRWLMEQGVVNHEIDPSSIEVSRRVRRAKTDRIDLEKMMRAFLAYLRGEPRACCSAPAASSWSTRRRTAGAAAAPCASMRPAGMRPT